MPNGSSPVFEATTVSGIILSYNAFQTVINIGGEIKDPQKYFSGDHDLVNGRNDHLYLITDRLYRCDHANTISRPWLEWLRF